MDIEKKSWKSLVEFFDIVYYMWIDSLKGYHNMPRRSEGFKPDSASEKGKETQGEKERPEKKGTNFLWQQEYANIDTPDVPLSPEMQDTFKSLLRSEELKNQQRWDAPGVPLSPEMQDTFKSLLKSEELKKQRRSDNAPTASAKELLARVEAQGVQKPGVWDQGLGYGQGGSTSTDTGHSRPG
jgi:hypothetical protein